MEAKEKRAQGSNEENVEKVRCQVSLPTVECFHVRDLRLSFSSGCMLHEGDCNGGYRICLNAIILLLLCLVC